MKLEKRVQVVLPVRVAPFSEGKRPTFQIAATYDISHKGCCVMGLKFSPQPGDILMLDRGGNRACYRVVWVGQPGTPRAYQIGLQCVEPDKYIWDVAMGELEEQYEAIQTDVQGKLGLGSNGASAQPRGVRAYVIPESASDAVEGDLAELSMSQCRVQAASKMPLQIAVQVLLVGNGYDLRLKGTVQRSDPERGLVVNLIEIRRGDRKRLNQLLGQS